MPDKHGFNIFPGEVSCIDCDARGPVSDWSEKKRAKHHEQHVREITKARERKRRQAARDARRLATQVRKENESVYGGDVEGAEA
jgi:hypothetical protein